jgi:hypothetical protein
VWSILTRAILIGVTYTVSRADVVIQQPSKWGYTLGRLCDGIIIVLFGDKYSVGVTIASGVIDYSLGVTRARDSAIYCTAGCRWMLQRAIL